MEKIQNCILKKENIGATDENSLWKNFNEDNFKLITLGHHYVRSLTHVHYLENLINVNYRENKILKFYIKISMEKNLLKIILFRSKIRCL